MEEDGAAFGWAGPLGAETLYLGLTGAGDGDVPDDGGAGFIEEDAVFQPATVAPPPRTKEVVCSMTA